MWTSHRKQIVLHPEKKENNHDNSNDKQKRNTNNNYFNFFHNFIPQLILFFCAFGFVNYPYNQQFYYQQTHRLDKVVL